MLVIIINFYYEISSYVNLGKTVYDFVNKENMKILCQRKKYLNESPG